MKKLFIANWKAAITANEAQRFMAAFKNPRPSAAEVFIAPPAIMITSLGAKSSLPIAAQDVSVFENGAFTGEITAQALAEAGVKYCLVGHSERRIYFGETDARIALKIQRLQAGGITPILCFGETELERKTKKTLAVIRRQLSILKRFKDAHNIILAYEPVWAISSFQKTKVKKSASDIEIEAMHTLIKGILAKMLGSQSAKMKLLYGGSVNPENSKNFINFESVDGVLVGAASLKTDSFSAIIKNLK